jgi:hypothetical protein
MTCATALCRALTRIIPSSPAPSTNTTTPSCTGKSADCPKQKKRRSGSPCPSSAYVEGAAVASLAFEEVTDPVTGQIQAAPDSASIASSGKKETTKHGDVACHR